VKLLARLEGLFGPGPQEAIMRANAGLALAPRA
jgi:hypothetical protein